MAGPLKLPATFYENNEGWDCAQPSLRCLLSIWSEKTFCHSYIVMMTHVLKKKRTKDPVCSFLRKLISPYGYGWKGDDGVGRPRNETLIRRYNTLGFMGSPTNDDLHDHF